MSALLGLAHQPDRRRSERRAELTEARITSNMLWSEIDCMIVNRSAHGARLDVASIAALPPRFDLHIPSENTVIACRVVWRKETAIGVEFVIAPKASARPAL